MLNKRYASVVMFMWVVCVLCALTCKARTSQTHSDQSKTTETRKLSTVESRNTNQVGTTTTATKNGDTCHKASKLETHQINKVEADKTAVKCNENSEALNSVAADDHRSNGDMHNDQSLPATLDTNNDHQQLSLKNLENS